MTCSKFDSTCPAPWGEAEVITARKWTWIFAPDSPVPRGEIQISYEDGTDDEHPSLFVFTEPVYLDEDIELAQFIVDALNEKEQRDERHRYLMDPATPAQDVWDEMGHNA